MNYDVVTVGNAVIDAFLSLKDASEYVTLNRAEHTLCVAYGQKILLQDCQFLLGGNACNVAVGLNRTGFTSALMAEIGSDEFSEKIVRGLKHEGVTTELIIRGKGKSSFSIGLNFQGERTLFVEHFERPHDFHFESLETHMIYLTSLGHSWEQVYRRVGEYIARHHEAILAFNPGSVQFLDGVHTFSYLFPLTTVLFVNKEEAEKIVGVKGEIKELLIKLHKLGPKIICLTDGERGAYAIDETGTIQHQEKITCPVVERTGAGDAFATGFLAAFLAKKSLKEAMLYGVHNAASVIGHVGAQAGLLTKEELDVKV